MNFLKYACALALVLFIASCSKNDAIIETKNETDGLTLATTINNNTHSIKVFTSSGKLQQGYNKVYLQIKNADSSLVENATIRWQPIMHMMTMQHSCPYSAITKVSDKTSLYEGYIIFQMAGSAEEYWELAIDYKIGAASYTVKSKIDIQPAARRNVVSFKGSDNSNYIIAMLEPAAPKIAVNDMKALVFRMQNMMTFAPVDNYTIKIDPRMPGMGNHGSPNNINLTQDLTTQIYQGKLSLTMSGYWKINLQLANEAGTILKGEDVTTVNESSSIYFEIEF